MRQLLILGLATGLACAPLPAHARDVLRLKPSTPWVLNYAEESCRLARNFGEGEKRVTLILDQFEPGDEFRMTLAGEPMEPRRESRPIEAAIRFGPHEAVSEITADTGTMDDQPAILVSGAQRLAPLTEAEEEASDDARRREHRYEAAPIGQAREAAATWLAITEGLKSDVVLETGPMDKPLAALRKCSWDTIRHWGLDVEQQKSLTRKPHPKRSPGTWLSGGDYPKSMIRGGYEGIVNFRLLIDAAGEPTSCRIQTSTRPKEFDDAVCDAVMRRAEFEPALDAQGQPVPSYWRGTIYFRLAG